MKSGLDANSDIRISDFGSEKRTRMIKGGMREDTTLPRYSDTTFKLDFSTLENPEVLENFDFDSFISNHNFDIDPSFFGEADDFNSLLNAAGRDRPDFDLDSILVASNLDFEVDSSFEGFKWNMLWDQDFNQTQFSRQIFPQADAQLPNVPKMLGSSFE